MNSTAQMGRILGSTYNRFLLANFPKKVANAAIKITKTCGDILLESSFVINPSSVPKRAETRTKLQPRLGKLRALLQGSIYGNFTKVSFSMKSYVYHVTLIITIENNQ